MRNWNALWALIVALVAIAVLAGAVVAAEILHEIGFLEAATAVPGAILLALFSLSLSGKALALHERTLGRVGGRALARLARWLGVLALLLAVTAAVALAVFGVLVATE